jgi:ABC-type multidrug transport system ATPase subunit
MLSISLQNIGKKYNREWIFRHLDFSISAGDKLVILGLNGSGKSTLLQMISGFVSPNEGSVAYRLKETSLDDEALPTFVSFAAPYLQLIEDLTLEEQVAHSGMMKPFFPGLTTAKVTDILELQTPKHKYIRQFSSGMKQRLKLGLAILSDTPLLLLDEPASNLDANAISWYHSMINSYAGNRTIIVCSNAVESEYSFCERRLDLKDYKILV